MSKLIYTYQLSGHQQDVLWSNNCPYCSGKINKVEKTTDYAYWECDYCEITFRCE